MRKKVVDAIVLVAVVASFAFSLAMIGQLVGPASPWFGVMVMLCVLGTIAFAKPLFLLGLPDFLEKTYTWEAKGAAYRTLGVPAFGALLRRAPLKYLNTDVYLTRTPDPSVVIAQLKAAESAHYIAGLVLVPWMFIAHREGLLGAAACLWALQIAGNLYPILHLRWARVRLARLAKAAARRRTT